MDNKEEGSVFKDIVKQATDEVLKPKAKDATYSFFTECAYMFCDWILGMLKKRIYGKDAPINSSRSRSSRGVDYNAVSSKPNLNYELRQSDELIRYPIESQEKAEDIRKLMIERIDRFDKVSVGFYYAKLGKSTNAPDYKYGWTNPNDIQWVMERVDGKDVWFMDLPKPKLLS